MVCIIRATTDEQIEHAKKLCIEYAASLGIDLSFQDFEKELEEFPGEYSPPEERLLLARCEEKYVGCVGLRKITGEICEMKRLYVKPGFRGKGIGKALAKAVLEEAQTIGYSRMRLDTLPWMKKAISLYKSLGFESIEPYCHNPIEGSVFMELNL